MIKMVFLIHRRADLDPATFRMHWRESHAEIAGKMPGLRKYVQNHSMPAADGIAPLYDGFAEMWFDDAESLERALATVEGQATIADTRNFIDLDRMLTFRVDEVEVV